MNNNKLTTNKIILIATVLAALAGAWFLPTQSPEGESLTAPEYLKIEKQKAQQRERFNQAQSSNDP